MNSEAQNRFDEAFKSWAERPPKTPSSDAARRVVASLPEPRSSWKLGGSGLRLATAAAGLALLLVVSWVSLPTPPDPSSPLHEVAIPPLPDEVVLLWLDEETPLYLTVAPPATKGGSQ
jgi:hypothetical protein